MKHRNVLVMISPMSESRLMGVARFAKEHGWHLMLQDRLGYESVIWHGDGVLATLRSGPEAATRVAVFRRRGVPVVDLTIERPDIHVPRLTSDHAAIGRLAAEHFAERQFRNAVWFSLNHTHVHDVRFDAFAARCRELGLGYPLKWVYLDENPAMRGNSWARFSTWLTAKLRVIPRPFAALTYDETDAIRLLSVCLAVGLSVPEEAAILSIGNEPVLCENQVITLSSIDQNLERGGYEAAALLNRLMDGKAPPRVPATVLPAGIVTRQSTDTSAVNDPLLRQALISIGEHLSTAFGAQQLADELGMPRFKVDRLFAAGLGHSVGMEIHHQRLARVKALLADPSLTVTEIASRTGFCNAAYLTNVFRDETGSTPRAWRHARFTS